MAIRHGKLRGGDGERSAERNRAGAAASAKASQRIAIPSRSWGPSVCRAGNHLYQRFAKISCRQRAYPVTLDLSASPLLRVKNSNHHAASPTRFSTTYRTSITCLPVPPELSALAHRGRLKILHERLGPP